MKYLLDTNVLSEIVKSSPNPSVLKMLDRHQRDMATAAPVWHELQYGFQRLAVSRKRDLIESFLRDILQPNIPILPYDERAAEWHAKERARLSALGRIPSFVDGQIAAITKVSGLVLVTCNISDFKHFSELKLINWYK